MYTRRIPLGQTIPTGGACSERNSRVLSSNRYFHRAPYTSARKEVVALLRQRSRPFLFSNSVAPPVVAGGIKALELVRDGDARERLMRNTARFRGGLEALGFELIAGDHPIIPIMFHDAERAQRFASAAMEEGVYVTAIFFPVVPRGKARIRTQMSSALCDADIEAALDAFGRATIRM